MRLKLAGGDRPKGSGVLCPWRGTYSHPLLLRWRASRPQLKRDPLGSRLHVRKVSSCRMCRSKPNVARSACPRIVGASTRLPYSLCSARPIGAVRSHARHSPGQSTTPSALPSWTVKPWSRSDVPLPTSRPTLTGRTSSSLRLIAARASADGCLRPCWPIRSFRGYDGSVCSRATRRHSTRSSVLGQVLDHSSTWSTAIRGPVQRRRLPNKRLKLTGDDRSKGSGVLCPWRGTDFVPHPCAGDRVARSLSAIR